MIPWQEDEDFCGWLVSQQYAEPRGSTLFPFLSLGCILYMHEAWCAGRKV